MKRATSVVGLVTCLVLAGCSTTVPGTPIADPSAVPKPETGSFRTTPRTIGPPTQALGLMLEGYRMAETVPLIHEIDPAMHFQGHASAGSVKSGEASVKNLFGDAADKAFGQTAEVGFMETAGDQQQGTKYDSKVKKRSVSLGVVRMPSPDDASRAVGTGLLAGEKDVLGKDAPAKTPVPVPGYDKAVAYTQTYGTGATATTSTVAFLAYKQYVLGVYGDFSTDQIKTLFDKSTKGLDGFQPTPLDKVASLPVDQSGVAKLTLAPSNGDEGLSVPTRQAVMRQTDVSRSVKTFADAGVDVIASGGNTVYRAKDAAGAKHVADEFLAETKAAYASAESKTVKGAPGATCLTYPKYEGSDSRVTYCVVPVGRYLAEVNAQQENQAVQAIGAAYLVLQGQP